MRKQSAWVPFSRRKSAGFIYVEYLAVLVMVGLVIALALATLGPVVIDGYREQLRALLAIAP